MFTHVYTHTENISWGIWVRLRAQCSAKNGLIVLKRADHRPMKVSDLDDFPHRQMTKTSWYDSWQSPSNCPRDWWGSVSITIPSCHAKAELDVAPWQPPAHASLLICNYLAQHQTNILPHPPDLFLIWFLNWSQPWKDVVFIPSHREKYDRDIWVPFQKTRILEMEETLEEMYLQQRILLGRGQAWIKL